MGADFEPHMVQLFRTLLSPSDVVADIRANIGLTALLFSNLVQKVYAFEPSPSTFEILQRNLIANSVSNVEAVNLGMGKNVEDLTITFAKNNRSGGFVSEKIRPEEGHLSEKIRIDTLDNFFGSARLTPSFLKIDVEGFEQSVVQGGAVFLKKHQPTVVMEMNHFCLDVLQRITIPDFLDFMRSVFPVLYAIDNDNATVVDLHVPHQAYLVMHEHVVRQRFPNLVGGFSQDIIKSKLELLVRQASGKVAMSKFNTPAISMAAGALRVGATPITLKVGGLTEFPVTIENKSGDTWYSYGSNPVLLSYHWLNLDGTSIYLYDGLRTPLSCEALKPGSQVDELINVQSPSVPGKYRLVLTIVQEGVCWFEDRGFTPDQIVIVVE